MFYNSFSLFNYFVTRYFLRSYIYVHIKKKQMLLDITSLIYFMHVFRMKGMFKTEIILLYIHVYT